MIKACESRRRRTARDWLILSRKFGKTRGFISTWIEPECKIGLSSRRNVGLHGLLYRNQPPPTHHVKAKPAF